MKLPLRRRKRSEIKNLEGWGGRDETFDCIGMFPSVVRLEHRYHRNRVAAGTQIGGHITVLK